MSILYRKILVCLILYCAVSAINEQVFAQEEKQGFFQISSFSQASGIPPENIISMDNNLRILLESKNGSSVEKLRAKNIMVTGSQIQLMKDWRLLAEENGILKTIIPILTTDQIEYLRKLIRSRSDVVGEFVKDDITAFSRRLNALGFAGYEYSIIFSYVLDELVWKDFEKRNIKIKPEISAAQPFWTGIVWAIEKPRDFSMGTTAIKKGDASLKLNWTQNSNALLNPLALKVQDFNTLLTEFNEQGMAEDKGIIERFSKIGIVKENGTVSVPIIHETTSDELYNMCVKIAETVADKFLQAVDFSKLTKEVGTLYDLQTFAISYHEFMFEFMDHLTDKKLISLPRTHSKGFNSSLEDIGRLVFIIRSSAS